MVNITKPPKYNFCNNYNTILKEIQEYQNLFPGVGPVDFSTYKRISSTVNYDIIEAAKHVQLQLEAIQYDQEGDNGQQIFDITKEQALQFQAFLEGSSSNAQKNGRGVRFGISRSISSEDNAPEFFTDYHIDDNEDKKIPLARRLLFTNLQGARDSLAIMRPKFNVLEPMRFKKLDLEPEPISAIDVLVQQLATIYLPFQPPNSNLIYIQGHSDVIVTVRKSFQAQHTERILCHSTILNKSCNAFKEMFDLYTWDMELQEKHDIHRTTTTDEGVWRIIERMMPIYLPYHIHLEETTHPPLVVKKKLIIDTINPHNSKHETFQSLNHPKDEDRRCEDLEQASDYELEENPLYEDYRKLVDDDLANRLHEFVIKQSVEEIHTIENIEGNIDVAPTIEPLILVEGHRQEVNLVEELTNLQEDMELIERRKFEANALLLTLKPFLFGLDSSEVKEEIDDLQKFVTLADMYALTNLEVNDSNKKDTQFQDGTLHGKLNNTHIESLSLRESFRNSLNVKQNIHEGTKDNDLIALNNNSLGGIKNDSFSKNSKNTSIQQNSRSQIKRPSEIFAELKTKRKESILRRKKSIIRKILYPTQKTPLIAPKADLLEIEQQLDLCLSLPMAWQLEAKSKEKESQRRGIEKEGIDEKNEDNGISSNGTKERYDKNNVLEMPQSEGDLEAQEDDEEDEEFEKEVCKCAHQHNLGKNEESEAFKIYKIIKGEWTCAIFYPMLEYFYTERCHVPCENVASLWKASTQILLQSLTDIIILHPLNEYCHLALKSESNRKSMLTLANLSYKSEIGSIASQFLPYTFSLFTAYIVDRKVDVVEEGFHELGNFNVCVLKVYKEKEKLFAQNANGLEYLAFEKCLQDQTQHSQYIREHWHGQKVDDSFFDKNRHKQWSITIFGPFIVDECFKFYEYLVGQTFRMKEQETFSLHMSISFLKQPVVHKALTKAFPQEKFSIESNRVMNFYIGEETHGNSLTLTGSPLLILKAIKCIPRDMLARMALRFRAPTKQTFLKVFSVTRTIGIDIEKDQIFLLKNYKKIKLALEYFVGLSKIAFIPFHIPREFTELVVPSKPF